jgi:hypothetical protein
VTALRSEKTCHSGCVRVVMLQKFLAPEAIGYGHLHLLGELQHFPVSAGATGAAKQSDPIRTIDQIG